MTKVMMVLEATAGGTLRHVIGAAVGCHRRGFGVHLVCATRRTPALRDALQGLREAGLTVDEIDMHRELHPLRDSAAALRLRDLIVSTRPDVLHLHSSKAGALGRVAVVGLGHRGPEVVYTPHAYAFLAQAGILKRWGYWCVERALLPLTDRVIAVSVSEGGAAFQLGARNRVVIIPNGLDATRIASRPFNKGTGLRVGWLGRLVWQKDPEAAVKVSFELSKLGVRHELMLGGDGPYQCRVMAAIRRLRMEEWVRALGFVHDTDAFHESIDVLLMTSRAEGLPYVGLDAMAKGVPIVAFDAPGVRDLVQDGVTGLLAAQAADPKVLADHIARLARDMDLRRALGLAAQQRVRKEFQVEDQVHGLCELYQALASSRASRGPLPPLTHACSVPS